MQMQRHVGPLPPPAQLADYEAVYPGAARWIIEEATKNSDHIRTMESRALKLQERDAWLHRLLPFGLVLAFLIASVVIAFASPAAGAAALIFTMAGVLTAYLTGRAPNIRSDATPPTPPAPPS
jgi:uncharacterized membrane protein